MKLTKNTKPKRLNISEIWDLYLAEPEKETPQWIIKCLDTFDPNKDRGGVDISVTYVKYVTAIKDKDYVTFTNYINSMGH